MVKLEYNLDIICKKCKKQVTTLNTINEDFSYTEMERSLGYETDYEYNFKTKCENCNNDILVNIRVYEYPSTWISFSEVYGFGFFKDDVLKKINEVNKISTINRNQPYDEGDSIIKNVIEEKVVEVPKDIMIGLYRILAGLSGNFSGYEVYDTAKEGMNEAYKFVIEYGNNNNINSRG
jgi:hypothetical protein